MRISFLLPGHSSVPIGGFKAVYEYSNRLAHRGHQVTIVHLLRLASAAPPNLYRGLRRRIEELKRSLVRPAVEWFPVDRKVRLTIVPEPVSARIPDGDVVFATAWRTAAPVLHLGPRKGEKFYLIQHYETWDGPEHLVDATWRWPLHKVVISKWLYRRGLELGCNKDEIGYIPYGLDQDAFKITAKIAERPKRIAMMFSEQEWKGSREGLQALELVRASVPEMTAALFGIVPRPAVLPNWCEYHHNPSLGYLVNKVYNRSRIFICSSWAEGFGLPPAEAMACGCAVASTDCGGVREFADHESTALLSAARDPQALAESVIRLLQDDGLRQRLARAGHERIQQFTWERSTEHLSEFISQYVGDNG